MFGTSTIVFLIIKVAYEAGFSMKNSFFIVASCTALLGINTFVFLPVHHIPWPLPEGYRLEKCSCGKHPPKDTSLDTATGDRGDFVNPAYVVAEEGKHGEKTRSEYRSETTSISGKNLTEPSADRGIEFGTFRACVCSWTFWAILVWQEILELDVIFTFGAMNYFLTIRADGDIQLVSSYTNIFIISQLTVLLLGPLAGLITDRNKSGLCARGNKTRSSYDDILDSCLPLVLASLCSAGYSICLLIPNLQIQYLSYIFIVLFRAFFFGIGPAIVAMIFPQKFFGRIYGVIRTATGFICLLQYPLFVLIQDSLDNDPFYVMVAFAVADVSTLFLPAFLYISTKKRINKASDSKKSSEYGTT